MVYFGGISGINAISTNSFEPIQKNFKPRLVSLNVGDKPICEGIPLDSVSTSLQWSNSSISGKVISGSYVGVSDQLFTFTLKNYDRNWSSPVSSAEFSYRNLPSGRYTLLVKCSDTNGFWSEPTVLAQIRVTPPFWRAWWFLINSILVIVLSTIVIVRQSQKRRYLKKIVELEHQNALEKERLRISRDLHDELGTSVSLILLNSSMALSSQKSDIVYNHLNAISKNTKELYDNMNSLIWLMKSENQTLENLLLRIREKMSEVLEEASFQYSISMPDIENELLITREACRQIFLTVKEAVNNAIKHSNGSEVTIEIVLDSSSLVFIITDNGLINNAVEPNKNGNGLNNMRSRTEQLGGIFEFKANTTKGFSVSIKLPINRIAVL
jgi:signal transduction histidine kinase